MQVHEELSDSAAANHASQGPGATPLPTTSASAPQPTAAAAPIEHEVRAHVALVMPPSHANLGSHAANAWGSAASLGARRLACGCSDEAVVHVMVSQAYTW